MLNKIKKFYENWKQVIIDSCELLIYVIGVMFMMNVLVIVYKYSKDISQLIEIMLDKMGL